MDIKRLGTSDEQIIESTTAGRIRVSGYQEFYKDGAKANYVTRVDGLNFGRDEFITVSADDIETNKEDRNLFISLAIEIISEQRQQDLVGV